MNIMEQNKPTQPAQASDEIDISQLFRWIGSGFSRFGNSILKGIASLRRLFIMNRIFFAVLIVGGVVLGGSYSRFLEKKYYTSSMIISCDYLNMRIITNSMEKLNLLCNEKSREGLSEVLQIDTKTAGNILKFEAKNFVSENDRVEIEVLKEQLNNVAADKKDLVNKVIGKIEIGNKQSFQISVRVYNPDIVKKLDSAIINYFRNNEYVKKRIDNNKISLLSRRNKLVAESKKLDSLKRILYENFQSMAKQPREGSNNVILSDKYLTDPLSVFKEDLNLNNEIRAIDEKLSISPDFEVVDGLTTFREPGNFGVVKVLGMSFLISLLAGYVLLGLWKFNQFLAELKPTS
jgi:hypothetical protein